MNTPYQLEYGIHQSPPTWRLFAIDNLIELNLLYFIICMKLALDHLIELNFTLFHYLYEAQLLAISLPPIISSRLD